jgi:hypothetical protein
MRTFVLASTRHRVDVRSLLAVIKSGSDGGSHPLSASVRPMAEPRMDYERHGRTYARHRRADPRKSRDSRRAVDVGAGRPGHRSADRRAPRRGPVLGAWDAQHGHLRERRDVDGSLRLVISEPA